MLGEGALGLLAVLAATAGFATAAEWHSHYASWGAASGLAAKLDAFVSGGAARNSQNLVEITLRHGTRRQWLLHWQELQR